MLHYESRRIKSTGAVALVSYGSYLNDASAVAATKKLCRFGELAEVWRGDFCVYSEYPETRVALVWAILNRSVGAYGRAPPMKLDPEPELKREGFLATAKEAEERAAKSADKLTRDTWRTLAEQYRKLADLISERG